MLVAAPLYAQDAPKPQPMPIFVTSTALEADRVHGFVSKPSKDVEYLRKLVKRTPKGAIALAEQREPSAMTLELVGVDSKMVAGSHLLSWSKTNNEITATATLVMGDVRKTFTGVAGDTTAALNNLANNVAEFVRDNRDRLKG